MAARGNEVEIVVRSKDQTGKGFGDAQKRAKGFQGALGGIGRAASGMLAGGLLAAGVAGAKSMVGLSRHITDLDAKSAAVFEGQLPKMRSWAEANKAAFGLTARETVGLAANFADLMKPMGFTAERAAEMSQKVLGLSGALAKWSGGTRSAAEVSEILTKAMLGEREELKGLGISISEAEVKEKALSMGLVKATVDTDKVSLARRRASIATANYNKAVAEHGKNSLQAEKASVAMEAAQNNVEKAVEGSIPDIDQQSEALATQQLIMEKSTDAQKAWAAGGREAAEAQNKSAVTMKELQESAATALTPAIQMATAALAGLAGWVTNNSGQAKVLAGVVLTVAAGVIAMNVATSVSTAVQAAAKGATAAWAAAQWLLNAAMTANPIGIVIVAIVALIAIVVLAYKRSETFRNIVQGAFRAVAAAGRTMWAFLVVAFNAIRSAFGAAANFVIAAARRGFLGPVAWIIANWGRVVSFFRALPGRIMSFLAGLPGRLFALGQSIIGRLVDGILSRVAAVASAIGSVAQTVRNYLPFSPAKEGPLAGSGAPDRAGQAIARMLAGGMLAGLDAVAIAAAQLASVASRTVPTRLAGLAQAALAGMGRSGIFEDFSFRGMARGFDNEALRDAFNRANPGFDFGQPGTQAAVQRWLQSVAGQTTTLRIESGGSRLDDLLVEVLRKAIRARGGNVQVVLGSG